MKFRKHTFTLCLSLIVSYILLPASSSLAQTETTGTSSSDKNPFLESQIGTFTPGDEVSAAGIAAGKRKAQEEKKAADAEVSSAKDAAKGAGVSNSMLNSAKKVAKGDGDDSFSEKYNELTGAQKAAVEKYMSAIGKREGAQKSIDSYTKAENSEKGDKIYTYTIEYTDGTSEVITYRQKADGTYVSLGGTTDGCIPLPAKLAENKQCLFCPLFTVLFNAANDMSTMSFDKLAGPITSALIIGFGIYIAFKVMFLVSGFTKQDGPKFISELLTQTFKVFVAILLLTNSDHIYGYVITPILGAGLEFGSAFLFEKGGTLFGQCQDAFIGVTSIGTYEISKGVLSSDFYIKLHCFVYSIQMELAMPQSIGTSLMCISRNAAAGDFFVKNVIPDFSMMIQGIIIWVFALLVSLAFAFYLIDATVRIGIVGALLPFLIACWPFKPTSKYTNTGFQMMLNSFFIYTFVGIVVSVNIQLMGNALGGEGGFDTIAKLINGNNVEDLQKHLDMGFGGFLILIGCCLFGFKITNQASQLAGGFASGGGKDIGANIGGLAASAAKGGAMAAGKGALGGTKALGKATGVTQKLGAARDNAAKAIGQKIGMGRYGGAAGGKGAAGKAGKGVETAGKATQAAGKGVEAAGKGVDAAGKGVSGAGKALSSTGVGAVVGAPMMAAGAATQAAGKATQAAGKATQAAGKGMQATGKGMQQADKAVQGAKGAAKAVKSNRNEEKK